MRLIWYLAGALLLLALVWFATTRRRTPQPAARRPEAQEADHAHMLLREEQLQITKHRETLADVTTHTEVHRELKTVTVPVTREELVVEKDGAEVARIPLREERVDVATRTVELNDVSVTKAQWVEEQPVTAVLKKEVARVETYPIGTDPADAVPSPTPPSPHHPRS